MALKLTKDIFVERSRLIHSDKYDYSKVEYINTKTKVCIICPIHGEFWQIPQNHLKGKGCYKCNFYSTAEWVKIVIKLHNNRYDYSKVKYINTREKVCIICPKHGEFWQKAEYHMNKSGCPKCLGMYKTTSDFIEESMGIHGNKYNYSKVEYKNNKTKVCIICPEHGEFWQKSREHLGGCGCSKCAGNIKLTTNEFIERSNIIHNNMYDYSKVEYKNLYEKVCIICPEHGKFWQTPTNHLSGSICLKCSIKKKSKTTSEFIEKSNIVHNNKYNYSKVEYKNNITKVCIICSKHGEFLQLPPIHLKGSGCPKCNLSKLEEDVIEFFNKNKIQFLYNKKQFEWLKNKKRLQLDFYLPDYNIAIECQGKQHFEPVEYFGGEKVFKYTIKIDKIKKELCKKYNLPLYYINYYDNIENKLKKIIGKKWL